MKTTLLSVALLSLFANGQVSAKNLYTDADLPKDGGANWIESYKGYDQLIATRADGEHVISGYDTVNITHYQDGDKALLHSEKGTLKLSANNVTLKGASASGAGDGPILIHAYGGKIDVEATNDIVIAAGKNNAVMSQAVPGKGDSLVKLHADGNITITAEGTGNTVSVAMLQSKMSGLTSGLDIHAGGDVTILSQNGAALQVFNRNTEPQYKGDDGHADVKVTADGNLTLHGKTYGLFQAMQVDGANSTANGTYTAGKKIDIYGDQLGVYMTSPIAGNKALIDAPEINISTKNSEGTLAAIYARDNANLTLGNGSDTRQINISTDQGFAISGASSSTITFNKSNTFVNGNTYSEGTLQLNDTVYNMVGSSAMWANTVEGKNSSIVVNDLSQTSVSIRNNKVESLNVALGSAINDTYDSVEEAAAALAKSVEIASVDKGSVMLSGQSGVFSDGFTADEKGTVTSRTLNPTLDAYGNYTAMTLIAWRNEVNHISQRLGDVRDSSKTVGAWARVYGYDSSYSENVSISLKANSIQVGGDYRLNNSWLVGGAFSYTNGDGTLSNGTADTDGYSLAAYLSGFFDCGAYVDFVGRVGRLSTDITTFNDSTTFKASYDNTTFGLSAEVGYRLNLNKTFYVEPQAELAYGYVKGDDFTASNTVRIEQDNLQTLVGRLGTRIGASFAEGAGTVFAHASVNHDFLGDADYKASYGTKAPRDLSVDIGGTWYSYGVGAQFNTTKNLNYYGTLERSNGTDYQEDYRYSVGLSYRY